MSGSTSAPFSQGRVVFGLAVAVAFALAAILVADLAWLRGTALSLWLLSLSAPLTRARRWQVFAVALAFFNISFAPQLTDASEVGFGRVALSATILVAANAVLVWLSSREFGKLPN